MAIPADKQKPAARRFARKFFGTGVTATMNVTQLVAALDAVYDFFDKNGADLTQDKSVQWNILQELPEPFTSLSTAEMKGWIGMEVLAIRAGIR